MYKEGGLMIYHGFEAKYSCLRPWSLPAGL